MARLVITHSTYVEGLIPVLQKLAEQPGIDTITPAVIARVRGRCPTLQLRISAPISGGHKLVARRGSSVQEVFVVTELSSAELNALLQTTLANR